MNQFTQLNNTITPTIPMFPLSDCSQLLINCHRTATRQIYLYKYIHSRRMCVPIYLYVDICQTQERHTVIRTCRPCSLNNMIFTYYNPSIYRYKRQFNLPLKCVPPCRDRATYVLYMRNLFTLTVWYGLVFGALQVIITYREKRQVRRAYYGDACKVYTVCTYTYAYTDTRYV